MAKSKISETHTKKIEGILVINENGTMTIDVEDIGIKKLDDLLIRFNGENIKFNVSLVEEITD